MEREVFNHKYRKRLEKLSTTNLSDALDKVGIRGAVIGIRPLFGKPKVIGMVITMASMQKSIYRQSDLLSPASSLL